MTKKVIIWGYPPHTHTHSYIHFGFAKSFAELGYDVVWYDDSDEYESGDISDSIIISEINCCRFLPINSSSKYFIHNIQDGFYERSKFEYDNIYNVLVYHEDYNWNESILKIDDFSWFDPKTKTAVIMWATDLLPTEIDNQKEVLYDVDRTSVNYVGSLSQNYLNQFSSIVKRNGRQFTNYGGYSGVKSGSTTNGFVNDEESILIVKNSYLNFDLRPEGHLQNGYIPCRIFKNLSYGCWVGTNSEKVLKFFDGRVTAEADLNLLYQKTEECSKTVSKDIIRDNQNYIKHNHTYFNRINSLLSII